MYVYYIYRTKYSITQAHNNAESLYKIGYIFREIDHYKIGYIFREMSFGFTNAIEIKRERLVLF